MKRKIHLLVVASLWLVSCIACAAAATTDAGVSAACFTRSRASVEAMVAGDFASVGKDFAPTIASQFPPATIAQAWQSVQASAGAYRKHGAATVRTVGGQAVVVVPVEFAHAAWVFVFACDDHAALTTAQLMPAAQLDAALAMQRKVDAARSRVATVVETGGVRVESLPVPSKFGPLRGALTVPQGKGPFPAVVFVGGSGPNDLDEAVGGSKPFRDIADGLARLGVASLRFDKRQVDYGMRMAANATFTVDDEQTDDALAAARLLARRLAVDPQRVFVLGHSQGGMLAPRIGQRDPQLAGLIMLAAPARQLLTVIQQQTREQGAKMGLPQADIDNALKSLAAEQALLDKANPKDPPSGAFSGAPQTWWLSLHDYDQVATAKLLAMPLLILQGGSDFQVSPTLDFDAWKQKLAGKSNVAFHLFPGLSHLFTPAGKTGTPADYAAPAHVDPAVIAAIATWIKAQPAR